ncbi:cyclin-like protein [Tasmannia lanceolata]|uniref:cyclin-like protein n=1 Tax=Tasmannia lanceolata TaxID=3420 RepID=UPI004062BBE8
MSQREGRDSQNKRLNSKFDRDPSPKRPRREGKPATERTSSSNHNVEIVEQADRDQKHRRRLQDALPLEAPLGPESKMLPDVVNKVLDKKADNLFDGAKRSSDPTEVPRSQSYFQHDERGSAGQGGRSFIRRATDRGKWSDPKDQSSDRVGDKMVTQGTQKRDDRTQSRADDSNVWHHDGFFELEAEVPPSRKRPAFREKKMPLESGNNVGATATETVRSSRSDRPMYGSVRREERGANHPHGLDKPEKLFTETDERNTKTENRVSHRGEIQRVDFQPRERLGSGGGFRGRDRFNGRYGERNQSRQGGFQVEKWKHDLFDEANRSPSAKNEEDQIAKVEALLAL